MTGCYIYGILREPEPKQFHLSGIEGVGVYTINFRELAAVVSDTGLASIDPLRRHVLAHTVVQDCLLRDYTVLPAAFGLIADGAGEVRDILEKNYPGLLDELKRLSGRVEFDIRVLWDRGAVRRRLQEGNGALVRLKAGLGEASSPVRTQALLVEAGRLVEEVAKDWRERYARDAYQRLSLLAVEAQASYPVSIESLLNAAFLIERSSQARFQDEVHRLDSNYGGRVNFKCVGPLPPYSFVNTSLVKCGAAR